MHAPQAIDFTECPIGGAHTVDAALAAGEAGGVHAHQAFTGMLQQTGLIVQAAGVEAEVLAAELQNTVLVVDCTAEVEAAGGPVQGAQLAACAVVEVNAEDAQALVGLDQAASVGQGVA